MPHIRQSISEFFNSMKEFEKDRLEEWRSERHCNYGVGCIGDNCNARARGQPDMCGSDKEVVCESIALTPEVIAKLTAIDIASDYVSINLSQDETKSSNITGERNGQ